MMEYRVLQNGELRASANLRVSGYAAVFGEKSLPISENRQRFTETVRKGAFARSLVENDIRALYNHDPAAILGRNKSGTLTLSEDQVGLRTVIHLPDTQLGRDVHTSVKRGDLSGMSFGFKTRKDTWDAGGGVRELIDVELFDVSIVAFPAYPGTSVEARSVGLPSDAEVLFYSGVTPSVEEHKRLELRLDLLRRL